ncbi:MAG: Flp pilus assembly complex ATPase component TadA [Clostridia bacterium]|nr:Flp pilus assembly complex ATPase component TadA [Clostridia bacterium]
MDKAIEQILSKLPVDIAQKLTRCSYKNLQEIRFRTGRPVMLYYSDKRVFLEDGGEIVVSSRADIENLVSSLCANSVYAYTENIKEGFITIAGGHRVGIGGRAVITQGEISNITNFSSVNIRIAREYKHSADSCMNIIEKNGRIFNTVIISAPGAGKTTLLRDMSRQLSKKYKVTVVDERFEIAAENHGLPQFDIGLQTDVLSGFSKSDGITHALRSLSPDVIICDEIGTAEDIRAIENVLKGGCKIITTMHGYSIQEAMEKKRELMSLFEVAVLLHKIKGKPEVAECLNLQE